MNTWEQDMEMTRETWDAMGEIAPAAEAGGPADAPSAAPAGDPAAGPESDAPRREQSPTDPWDVPDEGQENSAGPTDPWDDPGDETPPKDPWDDPEGQSGQNSQEGNGDGQEGDGPPDQTDQSGQTGQTDQSGQTDPSAPGDGQPDPQDPDAPPQIARLRAEVERLEGEIRAGNTLAALLKAAAGRLGLTPEDYLTQIRTRELTDLGLSADGAAFQAKLEQQAAALQEAQNRAAAEGARQEAALRRFVAAFPHLAPEAVPKEVWAAAGRGEDLTTAYLRHENRALRQELNALSTQRKNAPRTATSRKDAGGDSGGDGFITGFLTD